MAGATKEFEVRVCPTHRTVLPGAELCGERFTDRFGNHVFCDTAVETTLVEEHRLDESEERARKLELRVEEEVAEVARFRQALNNINSHIGLSPEDPTLIAIREEVERRLNGDA